MSRVCSWCQQEKPDSSFYRVHRNSGLRGRCKPCMRVVKRLQRDPLWRPPCAQCGLLLDRKHTGGRRLCPKCLTSNYSPEIRPNGAHRLPTKPCIACGGPKDRFQGGRYCKSCRTAWIGDPNRNVDRHELERARNLWQKYKLSLSQYEIMFAMRGGRCWFCGVAPKTRRLAVEHDHGPSKRVRGLACHVCNKLRISIHTLDTALKLVEYLSGDFDGRSL